MEHRLGSAARWTALTAIALAAGTSPARAAGIEQLVAGDGQLAAIRDGQIVTFAADGTRLGRCGRPPTARGRVARTHIGAPDTAEILQQAGLPDDDSTPEAEDAIEDERGPEPRRHPPPMADGDALVPTALAAGGAGVWAATSDGVFLVQPSGCRRVALPGRRLVAIAAGPDTVVAASAGELFRADGADASRPGGWVFRAVAALATVPRALAVGADGDTLIADGAGVVRIAAGGEAQRVLAGPVDALATCQGAVMALAWDGVFLWRDRRFARAGGRPPVRALGCRAGPAGRWVAGGRGVWTTVDGALWTEQPATAAAVVTAVADLSGRIWTVTDGNLTPSLPDETAVAAAVAACCDERPRRLRDHVPAWVWPTVSATVTIDRTLTRRTVTGFVVLRFPFDRPPRGTAEQAALALEWRRRDAAGVRAQLAAAAADGEGTP